jgi:hypothetical protein
MRVIINRGNLVVENKNNNTCKHRQPEARNKRIGQPLTSMPAPPRLRAAAGDNAQKTRRPALPPDDGPARRRPAA